MKYEYLCIMEAIARPGGLGIGKLDFFPVYTHTVFVPHEADSSSPKPENL
jgi:hypothetical protein